MAFNEDSRVKLPSILHLTQLGYDYISLKNAVWDKDTNIFTELFKASISRINNDLPNDEVSRVYQEVSLKLENEDLGKAFYEMLTATSGVRLIDFENFNNNSFHVVTELTYKNGEDEFRPDVICLINGMPLVFIEVKKPNNRDGVIAERDRINRRFQNKKFRKFVNLTQFMIFSNNMEYDENEIQPWQGAFYASPSYYKPIFNYFREELGFNLTQTLKPLKVEVEDYILKDTNYQVIKNSPEYNTNKNPDSPTNRVLTSLLSRERLQFFLKFALAYVNEPSGIQKHIMRYPQFFATKAIEKKLDEGIRKGIIWHTQGSGKTALAYYNTHFLKHYYQKKKVIPKFYFIVDRLDLLTQARDEFTARGLKVHTVNSKEEFVADLKKTTAINNDKGETEITVVNIQKFADDPELAQKEDYNLSIQRVYFLDEVHRSYNPEGSFLANLKESDGNAIKIGLTGTPLIGKDLKSKQLFGDYIHKYYYNKSIADGYTLRLIREEIATEYQIKLQKALDQIDILKGGIDKKDAYAHPSFVEPMLDYIVDDFERFRSIKDDADLGGMVICDSSEQAEELYKIFKEKYGVGYQDIENTQEPKEFYIAAEEGESYKAKRQAAFKPKVAALILYDSGSKDDLGRWRDAFKAGKVDFLFVYNMLLTGFDAKRLKKLYLGRVIRKHNLLQALTRVNRTYKDHRYGYVVDFADISTEFDATNRAYFDELQDMLGDGMENYSNLFIIRLVGEYELLEELDFRQLNTLRNEAGNRLQLINAKEAFEHNEEMSNLLNVALEDILFNFKKIGEEELILADKLKDILKKTREGLAHNFDTKDPEWVSLYDELRRLFENKNLNEVSQEEMQANMHSLKQIHNKVKELNRKNDLLKAKYDGDPKYARTEKRLLEAGKPSKIKSQIMEALQRIKLQTDLTVLQRQDSLNNENYFTKEVARMVMKAFNETLKQRLDYDTVMFISDVIVKEYLDEYYERPA